MLKLGEEAAVSITGNERLIAKYFVVNFFRLIFTFSSSFILVGHPSYLVMLMTYTFDKINI